jgi:hypothetical protein
MTPNETVPLSGGFGKFSRILAFFLKISFLNTDSNYDSGIFLRLWHLNATNSDSQLPSFILAPE